jgi:hypothetical protein
MVQSPLQVVLPQAYPPQLTSCSGGQAPALLQPAARIAVPSVHEAPRQLVEAPG